MSVYKDIDGRKLKLERNRQGKKQINLADDSGHSERNLRRLESKAFSRVFPRTLENLAKALNVPPDALVYVPQNESSCTFREAQDAAGGGETSSGRLFTIRVTSDEVILQISRRFIRQLCQRFARPEVNHPNSSKKASDFRQKQWSTGKAPSAASSPCVFRTPKQASYRTVETKTRHRDIDAETSLRIPDLQRLPAFARPVYI